MNKCPVTMVTVTYNAEELLEATINSVINQTYKHIEYIIIDGASTDKTIDIIKKYEDKINYWISEPDDGIYFAMNKAIGKATGTWINFMNAGDTFCDLDTVAYVMNHKNEDAELVYGNCQIGSRIQKPHDMSGYNNITSICHQTLFVKTELMKETLFDTRYKISADHDFVLKMFQDNKKFHYLDKEIANYLLNGFSDAQTLRLQIEGLNVLFANNVPENDIIQSPWYIDMSKNVCRQQINHATTLEKIISEQEIQSKQLSALQDAVQQIKNYSIWKHPIRKYKSYKAMLLTYDRMKNMQKGDEVGHK